MIQPSQRAGVPGVSPGGTGFPGAPPRPISSVARRFGTPGFVGEPRALGDLTDALNAEANAFAAKVADAAYDEIKARFYQDKEQLVDDVVATATPRVQVAIQQILNDANTQAAIGATMNEIENRFRTGILQAVSAGVVVTLIGTFLIVKFTKAKP